MILATIIAVVLGFVFVGAVIGVVLYVIAARRAKARGVTLPKL